MTTAETTTDGPTDSDELQFQPFFIPSTHKCAPPNKCLRPDLIAAIGFLLLLGGGIAMVVLLPVGIICIILGIVVCVYSIYESEQYEIGYGTLSGDEKIYIKTAKCTFCSCCCSSSQCIKYSDSMSGLADKAFTVKEQEWDDSRGRHSAGDIALNFTDPQDTKFQVVSIIGRKRAHNVAEQMEVELRQAIKNKTVYQHKVEPRIQNNTKVVRFGNSD